MGIKEKRTHSVTLPRRPPPAKNKKINIEKLLLLINKYHY